MPRKTMLGRFLEYVRKHPQLGDFLSSWKRAHKKILEVQEQEGDVSVQDYQKMLRAAQKGQNPYDLELKQRLVIAWDQFVYDLLIAAATKEAKKEYEEEKKSEKESGDKEAT